MGRGRRFRHPGFWGSYGYPYPPVAPVGYAPAAGAVPPVDEEAALSEEADLLEADLARIRGRLAELKKDAKATKDKK
jgi:hypothetical protein